MIVRFTSKQLRKLADQVDALTAFEAAGAQHLPSNLALSVDGDALAYAHWWDDGRQYMVEVIDFTPDGCTPLSYHEVAPSS